MGVRYVHPPEGWKGLNIWHGKRAKYLSGHPNLPSTGETVLTITDQLVRIEVKSTRGESLADVPLTDILEVNEEPNLGMKVMTIRFHNRKLNMDFDVKFSQFGDELSDFRAKLVSSLAEAKGRAKSERTAVSAQPGPGDLASQLAELARLKEQGALTEEEFQKAKARLLS